MFIWRKAEKDGTFNSPKKPVFGVTFDDVSETYHLLHQINLACKMRNTLPGQHHFMLVPYFLLPQLPAPPTSTAWGSSWL